MSALLHFSVTLHFYILKAARAPPAPLPGLGSDAWPGWPGGLAARFRSGVRSSACSMLVSELVLRGDKEGTCSWSSLSLAVTPRPRSQSWSGWLPAPREACRRERLYAVLGLDHWPGPKSPSQTRNLDQRAPLRTLPQHSTVARGTKGRGN